MLETSSNSQADELSTLTRRHRALRIERLTLVLQARLQAGGDHAAALAENRRARETLLADATARGLCPPEFALIERFGLSPLEHDVLELAVGVQLDAGLRGLVAAASNEAAATGLTLGAVAFLLASSVEVRIELGRMLAHSRLYTAGLLRSPTRDGLDTEVVATRRAVAAMLGRGPLDDLPRWAQWATAPMNPEYEIDPQRLADGVGEGGIVMISGPPGVGKSDLAHAVAGQWKPRFLVVDLVSCAALSPPAGPIAELIELVEDAALLDVPLVLDPVRGAFTNGPRAEALAEACERCSARVLVCVDDDAPVAPRLADRVRLHAKLRGVRGSAAAAIYRAYARDGAPAAIFEEAQLRPRLIRHAAELASRLAISPELAIQALGESASDLLEPTRVQLSLSNIVLAPDTQHELHELIAAIRSRGTVLQDWGLGRRFSRGRGISALFDGEPGTGKTMAAEVVAHEVGLPLKRVNIAALVDKYIGETEKNLHRIFAEARSGSYILLFDEADALFGTRTDVKGSNDRYANLEINVLLQLMEEHGGVVILTTNLRKNIDPAFLRRVAYKVQFDLPDEKLRERIWHELLPAMECDRSVDPRALARGFPLAGGHIKSAVLRACYRAASVPRKLSMHDLVECAELECQALGRVVTYRSSL